MAVSNVYDRDNTNNPYVIIGLLTGYNLHFFKINNEEEQ